MRLIFIGPPGSGKGTQAKLLSQRLDLRHIATGDILREVIQKNTEVGQKAKPYMDAGQLVPDDVVNEIVDVRFRSDDRPRRFVMDGYPRTIVQAQSFDATLHDVGLDLDAVIFLKVADEEIIRRISSRWSCSQCGAIYNTASNPPKEAGVCDLDRRPLMQREDDQAETVAKRLKIFHDQYDALVEHYRKKNLLLEVPGVGDIETIHANIRKALQARNIQ